MSNAFIKKGTKSRNELFLPNLRYVVADSWIDELGVIAFAAWLKLHSWVDRRDEQREYDRIPYTLEDTAKKLGMSKAKLYRTVIKPLWEHELIDLVEYEDSKRKTQKPKNIIVYESPRNEHITEIQPLVKNRDWKKDYGSASQIHGRKGGRPKSAHNRFKNETVEKEHSNRFKIKTVYRFKIKTVTVSKLKPNNYTNNLIINTNKSTNDTNLSKYVSSNPQNVIDRFAENYKLTSYANKKLKELIELHNNLLVAEALERAIKSETGKPIAYMFGVLRKWFQADVKSLEDIEQYEVEFKKKQQAKKASKNPSKLKQPKQDLPEAVAKQLEQAEQQVAATTEQKPDNLMTEQERAEKEKQLRAKLDANFNDWINQQSQ